MHNLCAVLTTILPFGLVMIFLDWPLKSFIQLAVAILLSVNIALYRGGPSRISRSQWIVLNIVSLFIVPIVLLLIHPEWREVLILTATLVICGNLHVGLIRRFCAGEAKEEEP